MIRMGLDRIWNVNVSTIGSWIKRLGLRVKPSSNFHCFPPTLTTNVYLCYVRIRPDPDVPREDEKIESGGQLSTVHTRTHAGESEFKNRGESRRLEPSRRIRAFRRTSDRDEGEISNISSEVVKYKYTKYIY